jgi:hypothetical protein
MNFLQAIPREEGYYATGARPNRNLNRGEIEAGPLCASRWGGWIEWALSRDPRSVLQPIRFLVLDLAQYQEAERGHCKKLAIDPNDIGSALDTI